MFFQKLEFREKIDDCPNVAIKTMIQELNDLIDDANKTMQPYDSQRFSLYRLLNNEHLWSQFRAEYPDLQRSETIYNDWQWNKRFCLRTSEQMRKLYDLYFPILESRAIRLREKIKDQLKKYKNNDIWLASKDCSLYGRISDNCENFLKKLAGDKKAALKALLMRGNVNNNLRFTTQNDNELLVFVKKLTPQIFAGKSSDSINRFFKKFEKSFEPLPYDTRVFFYELLNKNKLVESLDSDKISAIIEHANINARDPLFQADESFLSRHEEYFHRIEMNFGIFVSPLNLFRKKVVDFISNISHSLSQRFSFFGKYVQILMAVGMFCAIALYVSVVLGFIVAASFIMAPVLYHYLKLGLNFGKWYLKIQDQEDVSDVKSSLDIMRITTLFINNRLFNGVVDFSAFHYKSFQKDVHWLIEKINHSITVLEKRKEQIVYTSECVSLLKKQKKDLIMRTQAMAKDVAKKIGECIFKDPDLFNRAKILEIQEFVKSAGLSDSDVKVFESRIDFSKHFIYKMASGELFCIHHDPHVIKDMAGIPYGKGMSCQEEILRYQKMIKLLNPEGEQRNFILKCINLLMDKDYKKIKCEDLVRKARELMGAEKGHAFIEAFENQLWNTFSDEKIELCALFSTEKKDKILKSAEALKEDFNDARRLLKKRSKTVPDAALAQRCRNLKGLAKIAMYLDFIKKPEYPAMSFSDFLKQVINQEKEMLKPHEAFLKQVYTYSKSEGKIVDKKFPLDLATNRPQVAFDLFKERVFYIFNNIEKLSHQECDLRFMHSDLLNFNQKKSLENVFLEAIKKQAVYSKKIHHFLKSCVGEEGGGMIADTVLQQYEAKFAESMMQRKKSVWLRYG